MPDKSKVIEDIKKSTDELVDYLADFPTESFNIKPGPNSWSASGTAEHLVLLETLVNQILKGKTRTTDRNPEDKIERIKSTFLNVDKKLTAGSPILPGEKPKEKEEVIKEIKSCQQALVDIINANHLELTCLGFNHGLFGELTRIEWVYFNIYHSQRHLHQLKNIKKQVATRI
ncbi:MAG: hypothetical protein GTO45_01020 [Candidatus Aminicenantes bacterium]|nr:hypothetical protein [Candidatus Aminicenantes bacterium]NIM77348.1 hypothetical protein [Candidatus Aminicenantes bacterium]NIN16646.1 hypothetical protein [Candidatus Aminicenantes bacterium]NIN40504.1 hypothetical protein [Candidatus Aminicenantes bacterium]NIN83324.1 hypothetical protein [Candidatus Aminicenantes bacterium]